MVSLLSLLVGSCALWWLLVVRWATLPFMHFWILWRHNRLPRKVNRTKNNRLFTLSATAELQVGLYRIEYEELLYHIQKHHHYCYSSIHSDGHIIVFVDQCKFIRLLISFPYHAMCTMFSTYIIVLYYYSCKYDHLHDHQSSSSSPSRKEEFLS